MNLDIATKHIYDVYFLMIYFSIFVAVDAVVFPLYGASKDLIRDSRRL